MSEYDEIKYPICLINLYFEGDEDKCDPLACDWDMDLRCCTQKCEYIFKERKK